MGFGVETAHKFLNVSNWRDKQNCPSCVHTIYYYLKLFLIYSVKYIQYPMSFPLEKKKKWFKDVANASVGLYWSGTISDGNCTCMCSRKNSNFEHVLASSM